MYMYIKKFHFLNILNIIFNKKNYEYLTIEKLKRKE